MISRLARLRSRSGWRGIASISDDRIALALTLPLDSDALENERRALGADPEGATAAIRAVSEGLVVDAVRPDVTTEAFVSAVDMLKVLDPGALRSLAGRATILETSEEARAHWESAMREAGQ